MNAPLAPSDVDALLAAGPLLPYAKASLRDAQAFVAALLAQGVPAAVRKPDDCCGGGGCGPSFEVLVREEDVSRIAALQRGDWEQALVREGLGHVAAQGAAADGDEPPCPACGTAAPLVAGACSDCGLQLE